MRGWPRSKQPSASCSATSRRPPRSRAACCPRTRREIAGLDLAGFNAACRTVGGDYYDFFPYPDGRVGLALGDVSGKGMPASLMMMALHARVQVLAEDPGNLAVS